MIQNDTRCGHIACAFSAAKYVTTKVTEQGQFQKCYNLHGVAFNLDMLTEKLDLDSIANRLTFFGLKAMNIIIVKKSLPRSITSYVTDKPTGNCVKIELMSRETFFDSSNIYNLFLNKEKSFIKITIVIFEDEDWNRVSLYFKLNNISLRGGFSNTRRNMLSPVYLRLALFILLISDKTKIAENYVTDGNGKLDVNSVDYTAKDMTDMIKQFWNDKKEKALKKELMSNTSNTSKESSINNENKDLSLNQSLTSPASSPLVSPSFTTSSTSSETFFNHNINLNSTDLENDKAEIREYWNNKFKYSDKKNNSDNNDNLPPIGFSNQNNQISWVNDKNNINKQQKRGFSYSIRQMNEQNKLDNTNQLLNIKDSEINNVIDSLNGNIKPLITNFKNNPMYYNILFILEDKNMSNIQKQIKIEDMLRYFWKKEILNIFNNTSKLFSGVYGLNLLISGLLRLKRDMDDWKSKKKYFHKKKYALILLSTLSEVIISIALSIIIPICFKHEDIENQELTTIFGKIGKEIVKGFFNEEWHKYTEIMKIIAINEEIKNETNKEKLNEKEKAKIKAIYNYEKKYKLLNNIAKDGEICYIFINNLNNIEHKFENNLLKNEFLVKLREIIGEISLEDFYKIGIEIVELLGVKSNLFKIINKVKTSPNGKISYKRILVPDVGLEDYINIISLESDILPMVSQPNLWEVDTSNNTIVNYGGLYFNIEEKKALFRRSASNIDQTFFINRDLIETVNYLSSIQYSINKKVLLFILSLLDNKDERMLNLINIDKHPNTKKIIDLNLQHKYAELNLIYKHNAKFFTDKTVLDLALLLYKWCDDINNSIYFPYFIDWRGRLYTDTCFFSFQKQSLARSLIIFKKGEVLKDKGLEALKIYTANCFGLDKKSIKQRLEWIAANLEKIINVNLELLFESDEPLLFLACCLELKDYYDNPTSFESRLPIYLDATCSGLQHLSSMISESNLAKYVNIVKSDENDQPNDLYGEMVDKVINLIENFVKEKPEYINLLKLKILRGFIKRGIMTIPYSATVTGIMDQLISDLFLKQDVKKGGKLLFLLNDNRFNNTNNEVYLTKKEINKLAQFIYSVLYESFPRLRILVNYLIGMNNLLKDLKLRTIWLTPSGLLVEQEYVTSYSHELVTSVLGKRKSLTLNLYEDPNNEINKKLKTKDTKKTKKLSTQSKEIQVKRDIYLDLPNSSLGINSCKISLLKNDKISSKRQNDGIMPNLVHSMDAAHIAILIKNVLKIKNIDILTIHDCFATTGNHVEFMRYHVKLAFSIIYSKQDFIENYHNFIIEYLTKAGFRIEDNCVKVPSASGKRFKEYPIPDMPIFEKNKNFTYNLLNSQYFIN
jgi:DNA-directed RNA polymerase